MPFNFYWRTFYCERTRGVRRHLFLFHKENLQLQWASSDFPPILLLVIFQVPTAVSRDSQAANFKGEGGNNNNNNNKKKWYSRRLSKLAVKFWGGRRVSVAEAAGSSGVSALSEEDS